MKRIIQYSTIALFTLFMVACSSQPKKNNPIQFDTIDVREEAHLLNDKNAPFCDINVKIEYAKEGDSLLLAQVNEKIIALSLGDQYAKLTPEEAVESYIKSSADSYRNELNDTYKEDSESAESPEEIGHWYNFHFATETTAPYFKGDLLVLRCYNESYTGGAHGMYSISYLNVNINNNTTLKINDLFKPGYEETVSALLWEQLAIDQKVSGKAELKEMGYGTMEELTPTDNFALNDTGVSFTYNPYEIAPYSMGITEITIPYQKVSNLLNLNNPIINQLVQ